MRPWLVGGILLGAGVAGTLTELPLLRMVRPPDTTAAFLGALWITMPYLAATGLAVAARRNSAALIVLSVALLIAAPVGVFLFDASATQLELARKQAETAVLPGEDPEHGPGGMRKAGADAGVAAGGVFSILLAVVLPPIQLVVIAVPTIIAHGVSAWVHRRKGNRPAGASDQPQGSVG
jgi:hypothetical protein